MKNSFSCNTSAKGRAAILSRWRPILIKELSNLHNKKGKEFYHKLSLIIGYLIGDGYIAKRKSKGNIHHELEFYPDNLGMARSFLKAYKEIYDRDIHIKKINGYYRVYTKHKTAVNNLMNITSFGTLKWKPPYSIFFDNQAKKNFLRAYFDCEGYVNNKHIRVQSVNKKGLHDIKKLLNEFDIESKLYEYERKQQNWNKNYILSINKKGSRANFLKHIGFNHTKKQEKLKAGVA